MTTEHSKKLWENRYENGSDWIFFCPGCRNNHFFAVGKHRNISWNFDGNIKNPTFTPSLKITEHNEKGDYICHLNLTNGKIIFHADCTHELSGQTVEMQEL